MKIQKERNKKSWEIMTLIGIEIGDSKYLGGRDEGKPKPSPEVTLVSQKLLPSNRH